MGFHGFSMVSISFSHFFHMFSHGFHQFHVFSLCFPHLWITMDARGGYGVDGRVNPGEVQSTAVSGDTPEPWRR
jgi:hypothetical protein